MSDVQEQRKSSFPSKKLARIEKGTNRVLKHLKKSGALQTDEMVKRILNELDVEDETMMELIRNAITEKFVPIDDVEIALQEAIEDKIDLETEKEDYIRMHESALKDKTLYEKAIDEIDTVLELRELIESYELQFTQLIPENLRPPKVHSNPAKIYESRYERWKWILKHCTDKRVKVLADALTHEQDATDRFCVMVASIYTTVSKRIHGPTPKKNHSADEMITSLRNQNILRDASLEPAISLLVDVLPSIPDSVAEITKALQSIIRSKRGSSSYDDKGDGLSDPKKPRSS